MGKRLVLVVLESLKYFMRFVKKIILLIWCFVKCFSTHMYHVLSIVVHSTLSSSSSA